MPAVKHGLANTPEYRAWTGMIARCTNPKQSKYADYGGRGISVCERWRNSFTAFLADVGERPSDRHSLGRIDNDGNYEPSNVEWQTQSQQQLNKRCTNFYTFNGVTKSTTQWAREIGCSESTVRRRIEKGVPIDQPDTSTMKAAQERIAELERQLSNAHAEIDRLKVAARRGG